MLLPVCCRLPITFKSAKLVLLSTVRFSSIKTSLLLTFTSPDALILRSWLVLLTCILLLFIVISSVVNVVNVVCPETVTGPVVVVLSLNSVFYTFIYHITLSVHDSSTSERSPCHSTNDHL